MTDDLKERLIAAGLTKQQATSATAETLVRLFMNDDGKILIHEAKQQVTEMRELVCRLQQDYYSLLEKMKSVSDTILSITEAQNEYGTITDNKAKTVLALYAALLSMNEKAGAEGAEAVRDASYVVYAYLGGQAKRQITYADNQQPKPVMP
jgi:hypothetical protein